MIKIIIIKKSNNKSSSSSTSSTSSTRNRWQQGSYYCSTTDDQRDDGVASFWQWRWGLFGYNRFTFFFNSLSSFFFNLKRERFQKIRILTGEKSIILERETDSHPLKISLSYPKPNLRWIPPIWFSFFLLFCKINVINDSDYGFQFSNPCSKQTLFGYHLTTKLSSLTDYNKLLNFICILI